jgi:hypothetical protein
VIVLFATLDAVSVELAGHRHSHTANDKIKFVQTKLLSKKKKHANGYAICTNQACFFKKNCTLL